jgi:DNA repair protein RecN (Recombination protein N)
MIKKLSINNYALIQSLELEPSRNLSIVTGETGAGKSIMLGALGLLMGNRADTKVLWDTEKKCIVEAIIDIKDYALSDFFLGNDLDHEDECILRREILPSGKSRAFINDSPANLNLLKELAPYLMDIHSQHDGLLLGAEHYQQSLLDTYAANDRLRSEYQQRYNNYKQAESQLHQLETAAHLSAQEEDYKNFILKELQDIDLEKIDISALENELSELENAEEILSKLSQTDQLLDQSEHSVLIQLNELSGILLKLSRLSQSYETYAARLDSTLIELKDIHSDLYTRSEQIMLDPLRLQDVKETVDNFQRLLTKHNCKEVSELISLRDKLQSELNLINNREGEIAKAKKNLDETHTLLLKAGKVLTKSRVSKSKSFATSIEEVIHQLGIENGSITIDVQPKSPGKYGMDQVQFLFSANKGVPSKPIKDVASGGEFSRLIFAIKYLIAQKTSLPTIIFDEIDTGVSGEVANKMIGFMKQMASSHQILSISHLPQFAAGGDHHYFVYKDHTQDKTETKIKLLDADERVEHIARMIAGEDITSVALDNARELLKL